MRTLNWYDVAWSKTTVNVNEEMILSGKVHVFSAWPQSVGNPGVSFLNVGEPGPVLVRTAQFIGEQFAPRSVSLVPGKDYAFSINLRARRAGRWHVHAMINVEGGGPIIGPGQWIEIKGDMKDFTDPVNLLDADNGPTPQPNATQNPPTDRTLNIYYATNRAVDQSRRITNYSGERANNLSFGIMHVRVPDNHHPGKVDYDSNLEHITIQNERAYMENNFAVTGIAPLDHTTFIGLLHIDRRDTALVFVHGYNSSFNDSAFRLAQVVWDGQLYELIPLLFSWPSKNDTKAYLYDKESADISVDYFVQLLELLQKQVGIKTVHIIAHSMGNQIVLNAISKAVDALKSRPLGEIVLAAADVDRQKFIQVIDAVRNITQGMTLYASADDAALLWSGFVASDDRAGSVTEAGPIVVKGVESIDMTSVNPSPPWYERVMNALCNINPSDLLALNTHNTFVSPVIVDISRLVKKGEHPPHSRTSQIRGVPEAAPKYWRYTR
jgi:esterase/lipase superfamily enzyme